MVMAIGAAITQTSQSDGATGALPSPVSASVAHLKVKGTAMVASLAARRSSIDTATRSCRSGRSAGQMYGHRARMIANSEPPPSANTSRFNASVDRGRESIKTLTRAGAPPGRTANPSYRDLLNCNHPKREKPTPEGPAAATAMPKNRGLTARSGEATSFGHEHDQIDLRLLRVRTRQKPSLHASGEAVRPHPRR